MKCKIHGTPLKQGGCFQNIYTWCPACEDADTEPLTDPGLERTPTQPLFLDGTFFVNGSGFDRVQRGNGDVWVVKYAEPVWDIAIQVRGPVKMCSVYMDTKWRVAAADCGV